ncbi:MAG: nucleoside kinase [Anaerolineae bacterium]
MSTSAGPHVVRPATPRPDVQVNFPDGRIFSGEAGTQLLAFVSAAYPHERSIVAGLIDGQLVELGQPILRDVLVFPIDTYSNEGLRIYQRTMTFVLIVAARELYPEAHLLIDHSVTIGGFFCTVLGRPMFTLEELVAIGQRMQEIVSIDEPVTRERLAVRQAIEHFRAQGYDDKVRLFTGREDEDVTVYTLRGVTDCFYGPMLPGTGRLGECCLESYPPGFILRADVERHELPLESHRDYPKLMGVFREYGRWLNILGIEDVGSMNQVIERGEAARTILVAEALHEKRISDIADVILEREAVQVVLIAGPSSSGKTTFTRRLGVQLMVNGHRPLPLGLDDYFVDRKDTPIGSDGAYDFEALEALNLRLFDAHLRALLQGDSVTVPHFDFVIGRGVPGRQVQLGTGGVLLIEGIHGLNPDLISEIPQERIFRIYVSALTQLNLDRHNRFATTDNRLLRRMVRDDATRGISAEETLRRWPSVRRGEERNIFPYQENADVMFNSALVYELAVLKPFAEPLLFRVPRDTAESVQAQSLIQLLHWITPCEPVLVPSNSLLREFIGGSIMH